MTGKIARSCKAKKFTGTSTQTTPCGALAILLAAWLGGCGGGGGGGDDGAGDAPDTSPPQLVFTTPAHNAMDVATNCAITVTFSEAIEPATLNTDTLSAVADGSATAMTGSVTYEASSRTATFLTEAGLASGTTYTATVTTAVTDLAGNGFAEEYSWRFTTGAALDTVPPCVRMMFPYRDAVDVPLNTTISVTFSEPVDPSTIHSQNLLLRKDGVTPVAGSVSYVGTTAQFRPAADLSAGEAYVVTVTSGVRDLAGNALASSVTQGFATCPEADEDRWAPQVLSVFPPDGAQDVPVDSPLRLTFDEPVLPFEFGLIDGRPVAVEFNSAYTEVTMMPTDLLQSGASYIGSVQIQDMAGNRMTQAMVWEFSTQ